MRWWSSNPAGISRAHINSFRSGGQGCAKTSCSPARTIRDRDWLDTVLELAGISAHASVDVFACEPEWAALTREIGGDKVSIYQATTALQDVHHIQARPSLLAHVRSADLIVCSGADLEVGWLPVLMQSGGNPKIRIGQPGYFMASDYVPKLEVPTSVDRSMGDIHPFGNPHVHTDPPSASDASASTSSSDSA